MSRLLLLALLRLALAAVLIVAGTLKLRDPTAFATEISNYQLLPALAPYLAAALPVTEALVGVALLVFPAAWRRSAALAAAALFAMFLLAVGSAYLRGINIECGCFGTGGGPITALTLLRNLLLIAAALAVLRWEHPAPARAAAT
ncbi:MAG TPA: MauE/DoxX family redox-associated membrane protein [Polyangia bacterium]|jgi:uncharacterized membrane protein YphA (DoxX/SURF4 family)